MRCFFRHTYAYKRGKFEQTKNDIIQLIGKQNIKGTEFAKPENAHFALLNGLCGIYHCHYSNFPSYFLRTYLNGFKDFEDFYQFVLKNLNLPIKIQNFLQERRSHPENPISDKLLEEILDQAIIFVAEKENLPLK